MDENQKNSSLRRYHSIQNNDEENHHQQQQQQQQLIPISTSYKRRRSSITTESTRLSSNNQDFIYNQNLTMTNSIGSRKRPAHDDLITFTTHHFLREHEQYTNKRARYEQSNNIELENQPPRSSNLKPQSFIFHPQQEQDLLSSTWNNLRSSNELPSFFNDLLPSLTSYHHLSEHYSPFLPEHHHHQQQQQHHHNHQSSIIHENSFLMSNQKSTIPKPIKTNLRLLSPQSNGSTNFLFDNKQRTGNISPAHSDSSSESTSTCSSDDPLHHHHYHFHQPQPWRSYRERENYEQLLDLAEKLADPNRFNQVDIQQFFSYRYKTSTLTSKQTACVICMSHFKNNQHIRVLPCQHEYHSKCIARWFTMNSSCPICRRDNFLSSTSSC